MPWFLWSKTPSNNQGGDPNINWAEGQAPSTINNSARAMMAETAKYRDDVAGAIVTAGTSTAYTVSSNSQFDTLAHLNGQIVAFTPHATNGATVTLNVDTLGSKPLRSAPNSELPAGVLIQGTPYVALYNNADGAFYLQGLFGNPYNIPIGASVDFWGSTAPNSSFALMYGQAISRTTYSALFAMFGTTYGVGDGSTTFGLPDLRGRVVAGKDDMGGAAALRLTGAYFGTSATLLGAAGGNESHVLTLAELPVGINSVNPAQAITVNPPSGRSVPTTGNSIVTAGYNPGSGGNIPSIPLGGTYTADTIFSASNAINVQSNNTSGAAHNVVAPTIIANKLLRII